MAIQMRRGLKVNFDPQKMLPGEWAVSIDSETENQIIWMCFRAGVVKRMGTYEDFREQIAEIADEIAEEYRETFNEIKVYMESLRDETEGYKDTVKTYMDTTEGYKDTSVQKAAEALQSATNASQSATNSANSADLSEDYSLRSKSYAVGTGGEVRPNDDSDCAEYYYEQVKRISQGIPGIIPMGTITFAELSLEINEVEKYMFNISDDFVSDERFKNGSGIYYGAGSNVVRTGDGMWDVLAAPSVSGVKGDKETVYRQGFVNLTPEDIGAATIEDLEGVNADFVGTKEELEAKIASGEVVDGMTAFIKGSDGGGEGGGGGGTVGDLSPNKALVSDSDGNVASSSVTSDELGSLSGAKSNLQQQIDDIRQSVSDGETGNLELNKAVISDGEGNLTSSTVTALEVGMLAGAKSNLQAQIDTLASEQDPTPTEYNGAVTTILNDDLPVDKVLVSDENGKVSDSTITTTQLGYLDGLTGNVQEQINSIIENMPSGSAYALGDVKNLTASSGSGGISLTWQDPENIVFNGENIAEFGGTKVIRKEGSYSTDENDGTLVIDETVKDTYKTEPLLDTGLTDGTTYFYTLFPRTTDGIVTLSDKNKITAIPVSFDPVLANNTWEQISEASALGIASELWNLGDEKDGCAIIGFNHDDLADGSGKAGITFICNDNNKTISGKWNSSNDASVYYSNSLVRSELEKIYNGEISTSVPLSAELRAVIKEVNKKCLSGDDVYEDVPCNLFLIAKDNQNEEAGGYEGKGFITYSPRFWSRTKYSSDESVAYVLISNSTSQGQYFTSNYLYKFGFCV